MPLRPVRDLLAASDELKALSATARRLRQLQTIYAGSAPRELSGSSRVKSYQAGTLFVTADNGVVAAKLKQLAPRLLASVRKNEPEITAIRIEVQVSGSAHVLVRTPQKKTLPADAVERFKVLGDQVRPSALKLALANLVRHHRRKPI